MNNFAARLVEHLTNEGYPQGVVRVSILELYGEEQHVVEVVDNGYVIQAFILASNEYRHKHARIPFYKTYTQTTASGLKIYPACAVAMYKNSQWYFYNASETIEPMSEDFVNYKKAVDRFNNRLDVEQNPIEMRPFKIKSSIVVTSLLLYLSGHVIWKDTIPLDANIVIILLASALFLLLPSLLKLLDKVSLNGIELQINKDMK